MGGYGAYGSMGYSMPSYGATGYGMPPYGATGYGVPPYGATGCGVPPYGQTAYGQPMGMVPGMIPMGMIPMGMIPMGMIPQPKSKLELAKEQSERDFIVKKGGWICYNCQKANYSYVGSCSCGMSRNESEKKYADKKIAVA